MGFGDIFLGFIAILFPPIAVWIKCGICSVDSVINILLCMFGYVPGLIHAWYIIAAYPERDHDYEPINDAENQRVTYYYIRHEQPAHPNYGTEGGQRPQQAPPVPENSRPAQGPSTGAGSGEEGAPPSYSEVVRGDNKVQSQD